MMQRFQRRKTLAKPKKRKDKFRMQGDSYRDVEEEQEKTIKDLLMFLV